MQYSALHSEESHRVVFGHLILFHSKDEKQPMNACCQNWKSCEDSCKSSARVFRNSGADSMGSEATCFDNCSSQESRGSIVWSRWLASRMTRRKHL
jgi:hypothetical protein